MKTLMVQGTTSDAGKSTLVAGLCRVFANLGIKVAPFKPQNMALNSAVTDDGGEIGRAQALQAIAAKVLSQIDFNPVLLKPNSDTGAQVILHGRAISNMEAQGYHDYKKVAMQAVLDSYLRLSNQFDLLCVEGAGSPAEINLRENDIANMGFAEAVDCPVILIADIDKGGVFAHIVGTLALLSASEQARIKGFVINRFRGDIALLQSGLDWLEQETGKPVLGVLPYLHDLSLDAEDALALTNVIDQAAYTNVINIAVLLLPHISNHTDFDVLRLNPAINLSYVKYTQAIPSVDLIIIPGSKNVIGDLAFLREQGWQQQINQHLRYGGKVLGICGGLQMLGQEIVDHDAIESSVQSIQGLALADFVTELKPQKQLKQVTGKLSASSLAACGSNLLDKSRSEVAITGYEIHCGISTGTAFDRPFAYITSEENEQPIADGFVSADNQIIGSYVHGLFDSVETTAALMAWVKPQVNVAKLDLAQHREHQLERLAAVCQQHLAIDDILTLLELD
ncbi:cobyric acid synthase [Colwellia sp. MEBiC06753]